MVNGASGNGIMCCEQLMIVTRFCESIKTGNKYNLVILNVIPTTEKIMDAFRSVSACVKKYT